MTRPDGLLTAQELCLKLGISRSVLYRMIAARRVVGIVHVKDGKIKHLFWPHARLIGTDTKPRKPAAYYGWDEA